MAGVDHYLRRIIPPELLKAGVAPIYADRRPFNSRLITDFPEALPVIAKLRREWDAMRFFTGQPSQQWMMTSASIVHKAAQVGGAGSVPMGEVVGRLMKAAPGLKMAVAAAVLTAIDKSVLLSQQCCACGHAINSSRRVKTIIFWTVTEYNNGNPVLSFPICEECASDSMRDALGFAMARFDGSRQTVWKME